MSDTLPSRLVSESEELSSLPMVAFRLLGACARPEVEPEEVAAILEGDPALCADALRIANGAGSAPFEEILSIRAVCHRLGPRRIGMLASNVAAFAAYKAMGDATSEEVDFLWRHAMLCGVASSWFAEREGAEPSHAHTVGIMQNLSFLALAQVERDAMQTVAELVSRGEDQAESERAVFDGATHGELTAALLARWELPEVILGALEAHADDREVYGPEAGLVRAVRLGDALACEIMRERAESPLEQWWSAPTLPAFSAEVADVPEARPEVEMRALEMLTLLS